ncbi:MAG TPA: hypothetical protein VGN01_16045 [Acidobacteriaceae bacterium]
MTRNAPVLRSALGLLSVRLVLQQLGLALVVFALCTLWLRMPDASAIEVIGSALLALIILAVAGAGESTLILRLADRPRTPVSLLRGTLCLIAGVALWFAWGALLDHLHGDDYLRAGYLNSRFPHSLRYFFTFEHLVLWLGWMWTALEWIGAGVIAIFVFAATSSTRPLQSISRSLRSLAYWIAVVLGVTAATVLAGSLIEWMPGHGLRIEMASLILRLSVAALVDATVVCLLLAILAACIRQTNTSYSTPEGTPVESQPRTVENP